MSISAVMPTYARTDVMFDRGAITVGLDQRIAERDQPGLLVIAAKHVAEAELAGREPHG